MAKFSLTTAKALREKRAEITKKIRTLADTAHNEKRDFKPDEKNQWDKLNKRFESLTQRIDVKERMTQLDREENSPIHDDPPGRDDRGLRKNLRGNGASFRDDASGKVYRALTSDEQLSRARPGREAPDIGRCLRAALTGRLYELEGADRRAMFGGISTQGGFLLNPELSSSVIDLARSASVSVRAGAQTLPMDVSELAMARLTADPTAYWRHESVKVNATSATFDRIYLRPRMLACIVPMSIELIEDAPNSAEIIKQAIRAAMALKVDQAVLKGAGSAAEPKGIRNNPDVSSNSAGGTPSYSHIQTAVKNILNANFPEDTSKLSWIMHPRVGGQFDALLDTTNQPINPTPWVAPLRRFYTTSLPTTEGGGSNESVAIVGDFSQVIIGLRNDVQIRVLDSGSVVDETTGDTFTAESQFMKLIVAHLRMDVAIMRPTWFSLITGITG